jgi:uncharacterized protein YlbG (UPF0298 family)
MKKILLGFLLLFLVSFFSNASAVSAHGASTYAAKPARIDVLYMNHGPLMDTIAKMKNVFSSYGDRISVSWYEFFSKQGEDFKAKKGINQHVPLVIWIDGNEVVKLGQKQVKFEGFPTGAGPAFFQGKWTINDLRAALDQVTAKR